MSTGDECPAAAEGSDPKAGYLSESGGGGVAGVWGSCWDGAVGQRLTLGLSLLWLHVRMVARARG